MAAHSSVLAWTIPGTAEPGGSDLAYAHTHIHFRSTYFVAAEAFLSGMYSKGKKEQILKGEGK